LLIQPKPPLLKRIYPDSVWNIQTEEKVIYLTFDDGPIPGLTEWVLDELKKFNAKATFFCVGSNIQKHPELFARLKNEGHTPANHTIHHIKGFKNTAKVYLEEAEACRKLVGNNLFRPPYGQLKPSQYKALKANGFKIVFWDVISYDYEKIKEEQCLKNVITHTGKGSVVLFHDNVKAEKNLRYTLPLFLKHFANLHFEFKALEI
jgi:peptidoglycan/xylan/chitin deacetylase (PgdA/CDA1 family)